MPRHRVKATHKHRPWPAFFRAFVVVLGACLAPLADAGEPRNNQPTIRERSALPINAKRQRAIQLDPREAARIAKQRTGGKVLAISASGSGHRVKLLLPSGHVTYLQINADEQR